MLQFNVALLFVLLVLAAAIQATPRTKRHAAQEESTYRQQADCKKGNRSNYYFDYENPDVWSKNYPTCAGVRQSPINIEFQDVKTNANTWSIPLFRHCYNIKPVEMTIINTGNSVKLTFVWPKNPPCTPEVYGGPLMSVYQLAQMHFHWGAKNDVGSEHTIGNHSFPLEMHMVHFKIDYQNMTEALKHSDGVAVVGYLMSLDKKPNWGIERMRSMLPCIQRPGQSRKINPFPLSLFDLGLGKEGYFTYSGSLTTPPCSESVIWLLSMRIKDVTVDELQSFRQLNLLNDDKHNYRPTQPRNDRCIYYLRDVAVE